MGSSPTIRTKKNFGMYQGSFFMFMNKVTIQDYCAENNVSYVQARRSIVFAQRPE